jgi:hypothetical protein
LADQALYAQYQGSEYVSTLLLSFDIPTGQQVVDAGSPQLWRHRDKTVEHVTFEAQFPLGMFAETPYIAQEFSVLPGDRLIFVSDGVYLLWRASESFTLPVDRVLADGAYLSRLNGPLGQKDHGAGHRVHGGDRHPR